MAAATNWLPAAVDLVALGPALARWLRVAQREHYIPESASTFAIRWWGSSAMNAGLMVLGCAGIVFAAFWPLAALAAGVAGILGPVGLTIRGRTAPLRWTRRLRTLAAVTALVLGGVMVAGAAFGREAVVGAALVMGVPAAVDLACYISLPFESLLLKRHLRRAAATRKRTAGRRTGRPAPAPASLSGTPASTRPATRSPLEAARRAATRPPKE